MKKQRMRAWEIGDQSGDLTLHQVERAIPQPGPGELLIRVHCTGLNARDLWLMRRRDAPHHIPCSDNVGEVAALGTGVTGFGLGERVIVNHYVAWTEGEWDESYQAHDLGNNLDGFLAEYAVVPATAAVGISDRLPDEQACTLNTAGLTAWRSLASEARAMPSETVLTLGTGGVSVFGLQVAKWFGCQVVITSSSDEKLEKMKTLGADLTVNYHTHPAWAREVLRLTGDRGADIVLNNVGYPEIEQCFIAAGNNCRVIHIGASRQIAEFKPLQNFFMKGCSIKGIANGSRRMLAEFVAAAEVNRLEPLVDRVFGFDEAIEAVRLMETSNRMGKLVVRVSERSK